MADYEQGTVDVTPGSVTVVGNNTDWTVGSPPNVRVGDDFTRIGDGNTYKIAAVRFINATTDELDLALQYAGAPGTGVAYGVTQNLQAAPGDTTGNRTGSGPKGDTGEKGDKGDPATVDVHPDPETKPPGTIVEVENTGTIVDAVFLFRIPRGAAWWAGTGDPAPGLGLDGDYYIDRTPTDVKFFGPKAAGAWPAGILLTGDQGIPGESGLPVNPTPRSAAFAATEGWNWKLDTSGGTFDVTMPPSPSEGERVAFTDVGPNFSSNPPRLLNNGSPMGGFVGDNFFLTRSRASYEFAFTSELGWVVVSVTSAV